MSRYSDFFGLGRTLGLVFVKGYGFYPPKPHALIGEAFWRWLNLGCVILGLKLCNNKIGLAHFWM